MVLCVTDVVSKTSVVLLPAIVGIYSQWPHGSFPTWVTRDLSE